MTEPNVGEHGAEPTPYYKRTLDSFADDVITRQRRRDDGSWHAVLDTGITPQVSDPDFSPYGYGSTREEAAARCAKAIRNDAVGIGKFAPHSLLVDSYDLHWRLAKHWDKKERLIAVGADPNEVIAEARCMDVDRWHLKGGWLAWMDGTRQLEFDYQVLLAEACHAISENGADPAETREALIEAVKAAFSDGYRRASGDEATWAAMEERIDARFAELGSGVPRP